ncbi:heptaprenyl diphosphate synthase component II [Metasolibacillus sp.]|uniref:heptaprenyl diphosphate synthase component II n=1 Tax=Metasolibacillus sp. TaxID=2703680 RepID=UPI0025E938CE|nr:heptaprenyl diphosphate synthase component II [Metasolibacillus sp.]MCT6923154.1 heptaprenyl diphosphate synthase component II [Metasolibacillus sp.]MCT6939541.1 heptaprenyl diphosphate synthase component II [Metasolibacillus sp.]
MEKMKLKLLYADLKSDIEIIETELEKALNSSSHLLNEASLHLLQAGGKRIRPVFVLLSAKFGDYQIERMKHIAVPLELIHMASLVHDDVIDDSNMRRGRHTVKAQWNNRVAMFTGDFIFARALEYVTVIDNPRAHQILARTMVEICNGEIIQIEDKFRMDQHIKDYFKRIKRKTALLIESSCELGAVVGGVDEQNIRRLKRYGYFVGMSFQIIDDILDFTATDKELGKPAGSDLLQGNITLPMLLLKDDIAMQPYLDKVIAGTLTEEERLKMLQYVRRSTAIKEATAISDKYLQKALKEVEALPNHPMKKKLRDVALFIGKRKF